MKIAETLKEMGVDVSIPLFEKTVEWAEAINAALLRHLLAEDDYLISEALGLSSTGRDCFICYRKLCSTIIEKSIYPETAQGIYGLALLLERGILYQPPVAPALWRQLGLPLSALAAERLMLAFGASPSPEARLLEGVLCLLGQPLGVGQGNNPHLSVDPCLIDVGL